MEEQKNKLILASGSPRRKELLARIGVSFVVEKSNADETVTGQEPGQIVMELSGRKAMDVARRVEKGIILGADTIVWAQGQLLGKPKDRPDARRMLRMLSGQIHEVYTGVTILEKRKLLPEGSMHSEKQTEKEEGQIRISRDSFYVCTRVHVHEMSDEEIEAYLDTGDAFDKAGSYGIQGPFAAFVDGVEGDYQNVVGLPVSEVYRHLRAIGYL